MTYAPGPYSDAGPGTTSLTGIAQQDVEMREGETTTVEVALRDVVIAGRVTRGGQPAPGIRVSVRSGPQSYVTFGGPREPRALAGPAGPPPLAATTRDDGSYELVVFSPGPAGVEPAVDDVAAELSRAARSRSPTSSATSSTSRSWTRPRRVWWWTARRATRFPRPGCTCGGSTRTPAAERWGSTGADGRFTIAAEPGEYKLEANSQGRAPTSMPVSVGPAGVSDLRVEMDRGLAIVGRLLDAAGRPAGGYLVSPKTHGRRLHAGHRIARRRLVPYRGARCRSPTCSPPARLSPATRSGAA